MKSVLLGGRSTPDVRNRFTYGMFVWLPVAVMFAVIVRESTEAFSSFHTSLLFRPVWQAVFGAVSDQGWEEVNHVLRKTGHFLGYGTLGLSWLRAWLLTWMYPMRFRPASQWRRLAFAMAICCTAVIASMDELHQSFLPSRTGVMQDVLLDTLGACVLCSCVALLWLVSGQRQMSVAAAGPQ